MKTSYTAWVFIVSANILAAAEGNDLTAPKLRDVTVSKATALVALQQAPAVLPTPLSNPFVGVALPKPEADGEEVESDVASKTEPVLSGIDLLASLAAQIPASGTVTLGGKPILLLGQKRLKEGDPLTISFEDKDYEVSISAISPTAFTISRGNLSYTRPLRLSISTNNSSTRP